MLKPFIQGFALPVDREHFRRDDFKRVLRALEADRLVAVFPEGTIRRSDKVYPGVIRFAERSGREFLPVRFVPRRGQYPPRYPLGFPALTVGIGQPFGLRELEFDLTGQESKEERYRRLTHLLMGRIDRVGVG